jgi:hypothetical protein
LPKAIFGTLSLYQQLAGPVLTAGILVDGNNPPRWYLPSWTLAQMPMTHTILFLISIFLIGFSGVKVLRRTQKISSLTLQGTLLFALLTIGPYLSAIILLPPLYDGDRQFIMAYPFLVFVMLTCVARIRESVKPKFSNYLSSTLIFVTLVSPGISLFSSSPFTYSFRNEIISHPEDWEGDYMGVSLRRATKSTATIRLPLAYDFSDERWLVTWNQESNAISPNPSTEKFLYIATRRGQRNSIPQDCVELEHVDTKFLNRRNILSFVGICEKEKVGK